jgi:ribosomal protein L14
MIYPQTILTVADNTGAKKVMYSNIRRKQKICRIGDTIMQLLKKLHRICLLNVLI